jgi:general secretion pathway protein A
VNPTLTASEFLEAVMMDFGFTDIPASKAQRIAKLHSFLSSGQREGKISALIVDEAHKLSMEVLEEIRLLGNFESANEKLLQVALLGQSELDDLLDREELKQFKQRIALRVAIGPLSSADTPLYIRHRWTKAGGSEAPFTPEALAAIFQVSQGIPRVINVICDNALVHAFADGSALVELRHVMGACRDMRLLKDVPRSAPPVVAAVAPPIPVPAVQPFPVADPFPMKTLDRYRRTPAARPSLVARLASKLGISQRAETA